MFGTDSNFLITKLQKRSSKAVAVFTQAINNLRDVNSQLDDHHETREQEVARLRAEQSHIKDIQADNQKVIERFSKLFE
jgi:hypothetical protein